ncbi:MAG: Nudix family hydrolase [Oceanococcaceae bacterium]
MPAERPLVVVAAGVLQRDDPDGVRRYLAAQRPPGKIAAGKWEFPGGKIEADEQPEQALTRELQEELGIAVETATPLIRIHHAYRDRDVHMWVYQVTQWSGALHGHDGQQLHWGTVSDLRRLDLLGADGPILRALQLPIMLPITRADARLPDLLEDARFWADQGWITARLRLPARDDAAYWHTYAQLRSAAPTLQWIVDRNPQRALDEGAAGYHASTAAARALAVRPVPFPFWFGVSAHSQAQWEKARALGADYALLSPVAPTATHPDAPALGWDTFARIVAAGSLPTYALGGVGPADRARARSAWGQGVAGIRAFIRP